MDSTNSSSETDTAPTKREWLALCALVAVALVLRLYRLGEGLWLDEAWTRTSYVLLPLAESLMLFDTENQHLLFTIAAKASIAVFGNGEILIRKNRPTDSS